MSKILPYEFIHWSGVSYAALKAQIWWHLGMLKEKMPYIRLA